MLKEILNEIKPSNEEKRKINREVKELISKIKIKDAEVILGGSLAKDTWLRNTHDVDIFVAFDLKKYRDKYISKILGKGIKKLKPKKLHGSRDYFQIKINGSISEIFLY